MGQTSNNFTIIKSITIILVYASRLRYKLYFPKAAIFFSILLFSLCNTPFFFLSLCGTSFSSCLCSSFQRTSMRHPFLTLYNKSAASHLFLGIFGFLIELGEFNFTWLEIHINISSLNEHFGVGWTLVSTCTQQSPPPAHRWEEIFFLSLQFFFVLVKSTQGLTFFIIFTNNENTSLTSIPFILK